MISALLLLLISSATFAQKIYQIRADSVRIYNTCDTAELIIENRTQNVPGFLYNKGRGRTEFRRLQFTDLGTGAFKFGDNDTLNLGAALKGNFISNQYNTPQTGNYWISGKGNVNGLFTAGSDLVFSKFRNNETEDSVLTTDTLGNVKFKLASGQNIYNSNGSLSEDRTIDGDGKTLSFNNGGSFFAEGTYRGKPYGLGTYYRPLQNEGLRMTYGFQEIQLNPDVIRFASSLETPGNYQMWIHPNGVDIGNLNAHNIRAGWAIDAQDYTIPLDVYSIGAFGEKNPALRIRDGYQAAGKVLTSDANGYATWQTPAAGGGTNPFANLKNNETEDSVLTTDTLGNVKLKLADNIYNIDGTLNGERNVDGNNFSVSFNAMGGFAASGNYLGQEFGLGTYYRPMQSQGVRLTYGLSEIQLNPGAIRFATSLEYPGSYKFYILPYGTETGQAQIGAAKIGYGSGAFAQGENAVAALDVLGDPNNGGYRALRIKDGNEALGKVLTSDAGGFASWQPLPGATGSNGSTLPITITQTNKTLLASDYTVLVNNSGDVELKLPPAASLMGKVFVIKKVSNNTGAVAVWPDGGISKIEGASTYSFNTYNKTIQIQTDGTNWYIIN